MANAFITVYMTGGMKMDRHPVSDYPADARVWEQPTEQMPQKPQLGRLARSVKPHGELIVCTDSLRRTDIPRELRSTVTLRETPSLAGNFFFERWDVIRDVLLERTDLDLVYVADGRDVIVVRDPWDYIQPGTLYTCTEPTMLPGLRRWRGQPMGVSGFINDTRYHSSPTIQKWIRRNPNRVALNAGVVAADRKTMLRLAEHMATHRLSEHVQGDYTDMALFNWLAYLEFNVVGSEEWIGAKCHWEIDAPKARVLHVP
jgi:hypothetical protein